MAQTIAQALKAKKKLISKLTVAKGRAMQSNRTTADVKADYDVQKQMDEVVSLQDQLVELKVKIQKANFPILDKIYRLSELKDYAKFLQSIPTGKGRERFGYGANAEAIEYVCQVGRLTLDELKDKTEAEIEKLQEELDQYNHTTTI